MKLYLFDKSSGIGLLLILLFLGFTSKMQGQAVINPAQDPDNLEIGIVEHLDDFLPDSISLINEDGEQVWLADVIDKPTVINFVYYRCPGICSPLMEAVAGVMDKSELVVGKDYQVLTISFDPYETIDLGIRKKKSYLGLLSKEKAEQAKNGWLFFVSDSASIVKATNATGFKYKRTGNDYLHAASLTVVSPESKITRYLNGMFFLPFEWKMAIVEASKGQSGPTLNKVLRFCYTYDPVGQAYVLNITKLGGIMIMFFATILLLYLVLKPKRRAKTIN
ncbi:protein SCO1/2 [Mariniphaga anaerophila]|uniref:Protein SCO1/2 n=1 Tax=Mariniphaga anaerophila TaxID=1484053 RepID=A0A1M4WT76_9BACT|nr:SCO family protein [Mariniphaga anaerophila]SHE84192.1 protein SCO1/2 [Mariniphaga anaerophila]